MPEANVNPEIQVAVFRTVADSFEMPPDAAVDSATSKFHDASVTPAAPLGVPVGVPMADGDALSLLKNVGEGLEVGVSEALALAPTVSDDVLLASWGEALGEGEGEGVGEGEGDGETATPSRRRLWNLNVPVAAIAAPFTARAVLGGEKEKQNPDCPSAAAGKN